MENNISVGIYELISQLCEKYARNPSRIKVLRSQCYEILLGKKRPNLHKKHKDLSTDDPVCNLLAWQYILSHTYNLPKCAEQILELHHFIREMYENENKLDTYENILKLLLNLRDIPTIQDDHMDLSVLPQFGPDPDFNQLFKLPASVICESTHYTDSSFYLRPIKKQSIYSGLDNIKPCSCSYSPSCKVLKLKEIEEVKAQDVPLKEVISRNIWEIAATEKYSSRRTWESYGYPEPEKEPIFLTELGDLSSLWVDNLHSIYYPKLALRPEIKCKKNFIRDLKYLLVGMASESFTYNDFSELILIPEITLEGITLDTLETYSKHFTLSGTCYRALYEISLPDIHTNKYRCEGYIFAELCKSVNTYLQFYRTAIMSLSDSMNLLEFSEKTNHLRRQITTIASICKVGPYKESEEIPHGVALLNYLYQKITDVIDKKIVLVLYSMLFPCCQIYFGRFILQWILDGSVNDPYDEFFIKTNYKYISTRGRTYWTRSFIIRQDIIPDFLIELQDDILVCGKMMNLLKLCHPFSKLCVYLMGKKPQIVSCCLTRDQLMCLQQNAQSYYLEASELCGPNFSIAFVIRKDKELSDDLLEFISKKRAATLKRIELERQKISQEEYEKKLEERAMLKEQYDIALQQKQFRMLQDIEREIEFIESSLQIAKRREKLVQQEAKDMIEHYEQLFHISDARRAKIERHIEVLKNCQLDPTQKQPHLQENSVNVRDGDISKEEKVVIDTPAEPPPASDILVDAQLQSESEPNKKIHSSKSLDVLNANLEEPDEVVHNKNDNNPTLTSSTNNNFKNSSQENFEIARKNKMRVMTEELGFSIQQEVSHVKPKLNLNTAKLTDAQRNKLKVMSSEFNIDIQPQIRIDKELTVLDVNKHRMMSSSVFSGENYEESKLDNENLVNKNVIIEEVTPKDTTVPDESKKITEVKSEVSDITIKKSTSLILDFSFKKDPKPVLESDKYLPMSVDSTPLSEITSISIPASRISLSEDKMNLNSFPTTAATEMTDDGGFKFDDVYQSQAYSNFEIERNTFSKIISQKDVKNLKPMCLKMFLSQSLSHSLAVQSKLVSSELLRYFIVDLNYLKHLSNLKSYFFLQDGEFAKSVTEVLFHKLYSVKFPIELINFRVLSYVIQGALEDSSRVDYFDNLSFKINNLPDGFNLGDVDVLSCLSLTYRVEWPLNILLPCDALSKYNEVFKFLLKINRMNWVLKKIFMNLRILAKEAGAKAQYLMVSQHYRKIHQFRYVMMHFVQTLQNYITGEVFQTHWSLLESHLEKVTNLDELYNAHTHYLKNILFMCLLNQRSAPLKKVLDKIFTVILKFYDHIRSKHWQCKDGTFKHPSFTKLETIFQNFNELVFYLLKVGKKVVKNGYQPHFKHFLDTLNANGYYSKTLAV